MAPPDHEPTPSANRALHRWHGASAGRARAKHGSAHIRLASEVALGPVAQGRGRGVASEPKLGGVRMSAALGAPRPDPRARTRRTLAVDWLDKRY